ncbi:MAG: PAS domain-containing protein [Limisphaerales bacterium]
MNRIAVQFLDQGLHRVLFDAMPMPVFVMDGEVSVLEYNVAAARLFGSDKSMVLNRRGGDVWHCLHAAETPEGCGHSPACQNCVVRESVRDAAQGRRVTRRWTEMELMLKGKPAKVGLRVSCQPFNYGKNSLVLLVLEGLND